MTHTRSRIGWIAHILLHGLIGSVMICLLSVSSANAQNRATDGATPTGLTPGAPAGSYSLSGFENVNLFNGNLNFSLPLLQIGGRGAARTGMNVTIDSTHWIVERDPGSSGEPEVYNPYNPGSHPPIIGGGEAGYVPPSYTVSPELWEGLRVGYGPGVLQGRVVRASQSGPTLTRLTFTAPDGTEYELRDILNGGKPLTGSPRNRGTVFVSADGGASVTFVSTVAITDIYTATGLTAYLSGYLMMADGTRYEITNGLVTSIRDRNGSLVTFTYYGTVNSPWSERRVYTITDSLGRTVEVVYAGMAPANNPYDEISFNGFGGVERTIKIWRSSLNSLLRTDRSGDYSTSKSNAQLFPSVYATGYGGAGGSSTFNPSDTISAVELPDGRKYWLYYNVYGEIARIIVPTGGMIEYDYTSPDESVISDVGGFQIHRRVTERRVYRDAQTLESKQRYLPTYTPTYNGSSIIAWTTEVIVEQHDMLRLPSSTLVSSSKHTFFGSPVPSLYKSKFAYPEWKESRSKQVETLDAAGTSLRVITNTWQQCTDCELSIDWWTNPPQSNHTAENAPPNSPHVTETVRTLKDVTPNLVAKDVHVYDKYNNETRVEEYGYAGSPSACPLLRYTQYIYETSTAYTDTPIHLRSLPLRISVYDANNIERARTSYQYDNYTPDSGNFHAALVTYSPIVITGRDSGFASLQRGNATSTSHWLLNASGAEIRAITSYQQFDINGNVIKFIDALNNRTTFDFADNFGVPIDNEARANAAPTHLGGQMTYAVAGKVTNALFQSGYTQYDYWSGLVVKS